MASDGHGSGIAIGPTHFYREPSSGLYSAGGLVCQSQISGVHKEENIGSKANPFLQGTLYRFIIYHLLEDSSSLLCQQESKCWQMYGESPVSTG